jgi:hypothetical protein
MGTQWNALTCLGIPVPQSLRQLAFTPPVCLPTQGDLEAVEILKDLGKELCRPEDEIIQACNLASGFSDIVVILERPRRSSNHNFNVDFVRFVENSRTLQAIDELIRLATKGARSIHTVTVLNAFSYQPDKKRTLNNEKCHSVLAKILKAKKPRVVLRCHNDEYEDEWMKRIEYRGEGYKLERNEARIAENYMTVVLQSFHPSCAVNNAQCRPEFRALLMHHFVAAFSVLNSEFALPEPVVENIRKLCIKKGNRRDIPKLEPWEAAHHVPEALGETYDSSWILPVLGFSDEEPHDLLMKQIKAFDRMYIWFERLFGPSQTFGTLGIAKVVLFLWKEHFKDDPIYQQVMQWLLVRGNEQEDWFPSPGHITLWRDELPLEDSFSRMRITNPSNLREIIDTNKEWIELLSAALSLPQLEKVLDPSICRLYATLIDAQNARIAEYLRNSPMSNINDMLPIRALTNRCEILSIMFKDPENVAQRPKDELECDFQELLKCAKQLQILLTRVEDNPRDNKGS